MKFSKITDTNLACYLFISVCLLQLFILHLFFFIKKKKHEKKNLESVFPQGNKATQYNLTSSNQ